MKLKTTYLIPLLALIFISNGCQKEEIIIAEPEPVVTKLSPWQDIIAGDEQNSLFENLNVTLTTSSHARKYSIDLDQDGIIDLDIVSSESYSQSLVYLYYSSYLKLHEDCDIVIDSSECAYYGHTYYQGLDTVYTVNTNKFVAPLKRPKALEAGELINQNSPWYHSEYAIEFNSSCRKKVGESGPGEIHYAESQLFWASQAPSKYIGVRKVLCGDTLYAWMKLSFDLNNASTVNIEKFAIR